MKTHSSLIDSKYLPRLREIEKGIVEEYIPEASSKNNSPYYSREKSIKFLLRKYLPTLYPKVCQIDTHRIGKSVISWSNVKPKEVYLKNSHGEN